MRPNTPDLFPTSGPSAQPTSETASAQEEADTTLTSADNPPAIPPDAPPPEESWDDALPLASYAERAYLAYAMSVVRSRALPQVEDGLKPVQRRILHVMEQMRLAPGAKHVKSARVVGEVMGKYHPHGDSSIYEAMVRTAQDFSLRYPLVDGQGNFGSRDGDGAAAMRYTECRLTPIAQLLLNEMGQGTVDFSPNYDGQFQEPKLLPARLPFLLLNGASGIAVGMATEIPPHNLREVVAATCALIEKPGASLEDLLPHLPGPDFPGGAQIISSPETLRDIYATGKGSLRMRARWRFEELARNQWRVIIYALPHGVSCAQVQAEIEALNNPQPRAGKKELTSEQKTLKMRMQSTLQTMRDESSEKEPIRLMLEPRSSRQSREEFMAILLTHTSLESSVSVNMTMIGRNGRPQQKSLLMVLQEWIDFRYVTVERRTRHRLNEVEHRLHILAGRMIAFLHIDEIIRVIRESDEPKAALIAQFKLSDIQAEDILEIRLRQLARLEGIRIEQEIKSLEEERAALTHLLESRNAMTRLILKELKADAAQFGDDRRTLIEAVAPVAATEISAPDEPVTVIVSKNGWVRCRQGHGIDPASLNYKTGDFAFAQIETRSIHPIVVIDTLGRAYTLRAADLPSGRGDGVPITTLVELQSGAKLAQVFSDAPEATYCFAHTGGYGFICNVSDIVSKQKAGKAFMTLEKDELPLPPTPALGNWIVAVSDSARVLVFPRAEMKVQPGGKGVIVMALDAKETLAAVAVPADDATLELHGEGRGGKPSSLPMSPAQREIWRHRRARRGMALPTRIKPTRLS